MSKELVISSNAHETRVAILEEDQLVEIYFQRANEYSLAGSIHKGRVTRVLPGMQSAFVDLGLERDTFLYVSDFLEESGEDFDRVTDDRGTSDRGASDRGAGSGGGGGRRDRDRDRGRSERGRDAEAPRVQAASAAPPLPALESEPLELLPSAETGAAEPVSAGAEPRGGGEDRDRRGRRSRRRRSRGGGFPDSKYAADVGREPSRSEESEDLSGEAQEAPREVILLPGESLAKYTNRSVTPVTADRVIDRESHGAVEITTEVARESAEPEPLADVEEPETRESIELADEPEVITIFEAAELAGEPEAPAEIEAEAEPEIEYEQEDDEDDLTATSEIEDQVDAAEARLEAEATVEADEAEEEEEELGFEISEEAASEQIEAAQAETGAEDITAEAFGDVPSVDTSAAAQAAEDSQGEPTAASVRESGGRYPHRQSRRMRRKRGDRGERPERGERGGDRGAERAAEPRAEQPAPAVSSEAREVRGGGRPERERTPLPSIADLLREGQEIIVQIAKEPLGQKGARITSHIALPGRFVVYMPTLEHLGVSRKISTEEERQRLKKVLQAARAGLTGGFIVRTAGEGRTEDEIASDMAYLYNLWLDIRQKAEKRKAPALLHHDLDIVHRILRDQLSDMFKAIWVDNEEVYESVLRFMQRFQPQLVGRVKMYTRPGPIFDSFGVTGEIEKALRPKVWLKSGGYIVVNQTEALVAIDVNTGKFVGKSNRLEDTITKTNTEAVKEIVRQIRLRDLGGIIVIDFIDMDERKNRQKVMQALEEAMRADRAPYKILQFNDFGLVAITRKRVKQSLERTLCSPCPTCEGAGYTKSVITVVGEILQEAMKIREAVDGKNVELRVYPDVAKHLKSNQNSDLEEIESILGCPALVVSDPTLHPEKFDMAW